MRRNKIIYCINVEDIQNVAMQELDRELTDDEINKIIDPIGESFDWYEAISSAISTYVEGSNDDDNDDDDDDDDDDDNDG